jgi:hypothetical protein
MLRYLVAAYLPLAAAVHGLLLHLLRPARS